MYELLGHDPEHRVFNVSYVHIIWEGHFECLLHRSLGSMDKLHIMYLLAPILHNLNTLPSIKHRKAETFFKSPCGNNALLNLGNLR